MAILSGFYSILAHSASPESMKLPVYGRKDNLPLRRTRTELIVVLSRCLLNWTLVLAPSSLIGPSEVSRKRSQPAWRHLSGKTHLDKEWKNNTDQVSEIVLSFLVGFCLYSLVLLLHNVIFVSSTPSIRRTWVLRLLRLHDCFYRIHRQNST